MPWIKNKFFNKSFKLTGRLVMVALLVASFWIIFYGPKIQGQFFETSFEMEKNNNLGFQDPVVINFSFPVQAKYWNTGIKITPAVKFKLRWEDSDKKLTIIPENFWKPDTEYEVFLPEGKNRAYLSVSSHIFNFKTLGYSEVANIIPQPDAKDALIDIEDPIRVDFKKSTSDFFIKFALNPEAELSYQNNPEKTWFKLLPKNGTEYATKYELKIFAKYKYDKEDNYRQIYETSFTTALPPKIDWDKNYAIRLEQAKKYANAKINDGKYIDINLTSQIMSIFENGKIMDAYMISSGKRGLETPKGETQIFNKAPRPYSREYGLFMPYWMALAAGGKFGIHELPEWPGGYKEGAAHLGIPVSHGCVRLGIGPAKRIYDWAEIGTPVVIY